MDKSFEKRVKDMLRDPNFRIVMRSLELYDTGLEREEAIEQARIDWWIDHKKPGNGIGPVCIVCQKLIDWAATDHDQDCTVLEYFGIEWRPHPGLKGLLEASVDDHGVPNPAVMRKIIDKFVPETPEGV